MPAGRPRPVGGRLFRYDLAIVVAAGRAALSGWHDRLIAALMLSAAIAAIRLNATGVVTTMLVATAAAAGFVAALALGRIVDGRLAYHASDGQLAADALCPEARRRYRRASHGIALAILIPVVLAAAPVELAEPCPASSAAVSSPAL